MIQGLVRTRGVVEVNVFREDPYQMRFVEDDDMVKTVSTNCTDHTFNERILPGRTWCDYDLLGSHVIESRTEVFAIYAITITDQVFRSFVEREGIDDLLCCPCRGWMCGDVEVSYFAPIVSKHDEAVGTRKLNVGMVKKSIAAMSFAWLFRNDLHVWDGGFLLRILYFLIVDSACP